MKPLLAVTMGDPAGIGPEIGLKALTDPRVGEIARCVLVGPMSVARETARWLACNGPIKQIVGLSSLADPWADDQIAVVPTREPGEPILFGQLSAPAGLAGVEAVESAARLALAGEVDAIVTAPLNKEAMRLAGVEYPGHTEMLAALTGGLATMLLMQGNLRIIHVSVHVSLRDAIARTTRPNIARAIEQAAEAGRLLGIVNPHIAVAGLNPHAGEGGMFGSEERDEIVPAIADAVSAGHRVTGPLPPDTVFLRASRGEFDLVVAMYHDQGHIAAKMGGLEGGVNVTIGLPIIRTSVDHGTAFDIAGRGIAQHESMVEAIRVAVGMARARSCAQ